MNNTDKNVSSNKYREEMEKMNQSNRSGNSDNRDKNDSDARKNNQERGAKETSGN